MKTVLFSALLFISFTSKSQCSAYPHGTMLFAYICEDGIIMAADSRGSWDKGLDSSNNYILYAYMDSIRKIYPLGKYVVMSTGIGGYKNRSISSLIMEFNSKNKVDTSIKQTFENYKKFVQKKMKITDSVFYLTKYVVGGYERGEPFVWWLDSIKHEYIHSSGAILFSDSIGQKYYFPLYFPQCAYQITMIKEMYSEVSKEVDYIGGPVNILKINKNNMVEELNGFHFSKEYDTSKEYWKAIFGEELNIFYKYKWSKDWLMAAAKCGMKCECY